MPGVQAADAVVLGRVMGRVTGAGRVEPPAAVGPRRGAVRPGEALLAGLSDDDPGAQAVERPGDQRDVGHGRTAATGAGGDAGAGVGTGAGGATTSTTMRREGPETMVRSSALPRAGGQGRRSGRARSGVRTMPRRWRATVRVCPFCGEPPGTGVFCAACGRNLAAVERLPTRAEWEAGAEPATRAAATGRPRRRRTARSPSAAPRRRRVPRRDARGRHPRARGAGRCPTPRRRASSAARRRSRLGRAAGRVGRRARRPGTTSPGSCSTPRAPTTSSTARSAAGASATSRSSTTPRGPSRSRCRSRGGCRGARRRCCAEHGVCLGAQKPSRRLREAGSLRLRTRLGAGIW